MHFQVLLWYQNWFSNLGMIGVIVTSLISSYLGVLAIYKFEDPQPTKGPWPAWVVVTCSIQKTGSEGNRSESWRWHPSLPQSQVSIRQWGQRLCSQKDYWEKMNQALGTHEICFVMTCFHSLFNVNNRKWCEMPGCCEYLQIGVGELQHTGEEVYR